MTVDSAEARITFTGEVACWLIDAAPSGTTDIGGDMPHSSWIIGCYSNCTAVNDCWGGKRNKQRKVQIHGLILDVLVGLVLLHHCGRTSPWHAVVWQFSVSCSQVFPLKPSGHAQKKSWSMLWHLASFLQGFGSQVFEGDQAEVWGNQEDKNRSRLEQRQQLQIKLKNWFVKCHLNL